METRFIHIYSLGSQKYFLRDAVHSEANDSKFSAQPSTPMTAILDGNNSRVSEDQLETVVLIVLALGLFGGSLWASQPECKAR